MTPLTPAQARLVDKLHALGMRAGSSYNAERTNPYSGKAHTLPPLGCALYDWIVSPTRGDNVNSGKEDMHTWNRARMLFLELWPDEYYDLID